MSVDFSALADRINQYLPSQPPRYNEATIANIQFNQFADITCNLLLLLNYHKCYDIYQCKQLSSNTITHQRNNIIESSYKQQYTQQLYHDFNTICNVDHANNKDILGMLNGCVADKITVTSNKLLTYQLLNALLDRCAQISPPTNTILQAPNIAAQRAAVGISDVSPNKRVINHTRTITTTTHSNNQQPTMEQTKNSAVNDNNQFAAQNRSNMYVNVNEHIKTGNTALSDYLNDTDDNISHTMLHDKSNTQPHNIKQSIQQSRPIKQNIKSTATTARKPAVSESSQLSRKLVSDISGSLIPPLASGIDIHSAETQQLETCSKHELINMISQQRQQCTTLQHELSELRAMYKHIIDSESNESTNPLHSTQRINMLKAQLQLYQRQNELQQEADRIRIHSIHETSQVMQSLKQAIHTLLHNNQLPDNVRLDDYKIKNDTIQRALIDCNKSIDSAMKRVESNMHSMSSQSQYSNQLMSLLSNSNTDNTYINNHNNKIDTKIFTQLESNLQQLYNTLQSSHSQLSSIVSYSHLPLPQFTADTIASTNHSIHTINQSTLPQFLQPLLQHIKQSLQLISSLHIINEPASIPSKLSSIIKKLEKLCNKLNHNELHKYIDVLKHEITSVQTLNQLQTTELTCYRATQSLCNDINQKMLVQLDNELQRFVQSKSQLYRDITDSINQSLNDWSRNSDSTNIPRLLSLMQSLLPDIKKFTTAALNGAVDDKISLVQQFDNRSKQLLRQYHNDVEKLIQQIKQSSTPST